MVFYLKIIVYQPYILMRDFILFYYSIAYYDNYCYE